jgi:hypothetical protein
MFHAENAPVKNAFVNNLQIGHFLTSSLRLSPDLPRIVDRQAHKSGSPPLIFSSFLHYTTGVCPDSLHILSRPLLCLESAAGS